MLETGLQSSAIYPGAMLCWHLYTWTHRLNWIRLATSSQCRVWRRNWVSRRGSLSRNNSPTVGPISTGWHRSSYGLVMVCHGNGALVYDSHLYSTVTATVYSTVDMRRRLTRRCLLQHGQTWSNMERQPHHALQARSAVYLLITAVKLINCKLDSIR